MKWRLYHAGRLRPGDYGIQPDGRLFQVNYAREAVKRGGATAVGVKWKDGVVLAVEKRITSKLIEPSSYEKIFLIDDHIAAAPSGIIADARVLVDRASLRPRFTASPTANPSRSPFW